MTALIARKPDLKTLQLVDALGGRWHGYSALCRCPAHADATPSLSIRQGDRALLVTCFAGCDPIDVLRALRFVSPGAMPDTLPPPRDAGVSNNALRLWEQSSPVVGTLASHYLERRGLPGTLPRLRFHLRCPFGAKPDTIFAPALLVGVFTGVTFRAIMRIMLSGAGRAMQKCVLGRMENGAWSFPIADSSTLALAEGFETAAAYTCLTGIPCWASLGARRLPLLAIPSSVTRLILATDNDTEGRNAGSKAREAYTTSGRSIIQDHPRTPDFDWADVLAARTGRGDGRKGLIAEGTRV